MVGSGELRRFGSRSRLHPARFQAQQATQAVAQRSKVFELAWLQVFELATATWQLEMPIKQTSRTKKNQRSKVLGFFGRVPGDTIWEQEHDLPKGWAGLGFLDP